MLFNVRCVYSSLCRRGRGRGRGRGGRFVAFGMGATSFVGAVRLKRPATLAGYRAWVAGGGDACALVGGEEVDEGERGLQDELRAWDDLTEVLMVGLRMRQGLALDGTPPPRPSAAPLRRATAGRPRAGRGVRCAHGAWRGRGQSCARGFRRRRSRARWRHCSLIATGGWWKSRRVWGPRPRARECAAAGG